MLSVSLTGPEWVALSVGVYLVALYIGRRQIVVKPDLARFLARAADVQARTIEVTVGGTTDRTTTRQLAATRMQTDAVALVIGESAEDDVAPEPGERLSAWRLKLSKVRWPWRLTRPADVTAAWTLLHAAELELLTVTATTAKEGAPVRQNAAPQIPPTQQGDGKDAPNPELKQRTLAVEAELAGLKSSGAQLLREKKPHDGQWLLAATEFLYENKDNNHAEAASWHRRMFWLANVGCLGVLLLGVAVSDVRILLFGTLGGLASRLSRSLTRATAESDHGLRWSALFIAPVLGALAAPCGLLLLAAAGSVGVLGDKLKGIESAVFACGDACTDGVQPVSIAVVLGLAFLLGFAERFLTGLVDRTIESYLPEDRP